MTFKEFQIAATRTMPDLHQQYAIEDSSLNISYLNANLAKELTGGKDKRYIKIPNILNHTHMALGYGGELNELLDAIGAEDKVGIAEESVDILWYLANDLTLLHSKLLISTADYERLAEYRFDVQPQITEGRFGIANYFSWFHGVVYNTSKLIDLHKRQFAYGKPMEITMFIKHTENLLGAINNLGLYYSVSIEDGMTKVINKLKLRFPEKFSDDLAVNRNLSAERNALES